MGFEPWQLGAMEEFGHMDTSSGLVHRVARALAKSSNDTLEEEEFRDTCIACGVDPDSFTENDLDQLRGLLND